MNKEVFSWMLKRVRAAVNTDLAALAARVGLLEQWWDFLVWRHGVETVIADGDGSTYAKIFTETITSGDSTIATCVTKKALTGTQFVSVYTIGETTRTLTTTKIAEGQWKDVWS